jgi:dodecin
MITTKTGEFIGYSNSSIDEAIKNALQKAGEHSYFEVIETLGSHLGEGIRHYQVTIAAFFD